jgi:hypothetical protein
MLVATRTQKRFLEMTQLVLAFIGTCTVVDTTLAQTTPTRPGFSSSVPLRAANGDRRFNDLARTDRKRREAEQQANRRGAAREAGITRRVRDPGA